jgi:hypothetical protein
MTPFTFFTHPVDEATLAKLPDFMVLKDTRDGALVVRRHTERYVPVPRKPVEK